jgi:hypothetical protein
MTGGFEINSFRIYKITLDGEAGPDIATEDVAVRIHTTRDYFRSSRPAPSRRTVTAGRGTQGSLFPPGWNDVPEYSPDEVECPCGNTETLWSGESRVCRACGGYELAPGQEPWPVEDVPAITWLTHHCNECGQVWSQKIIARRCIKCNSTWVEVTGKKNVGKKPMRVRDRKPARDTRKGARKGAGTTGGNGRKTAPDGPALWVCKCGQSMVSSGTPKKCPRCNRKKSKHFRCDGALSAEDFAALRRMRGTGSATGATKPCHDCNAPIPEDGPSRCDPCRVKRNARRKAARRAKKTGARK